MIQRGVVRNLKDRSYTLKVASESRILKLETYTTLTVRLSIWCIQRSVYPSIVGALQPLCGTQNIQARRIGL